MDRNPGWAPVISPIDQSDQRKLDPSEPGRIDSMGVFVRELASGIADLADADQWAIRIKGVDDAGRRALPDLIPGWWLTVLDGDRPGTHRVALPMRSGRRDLGIVRLESWRPGGFREQDLVAARRATNSAARLLDMLIPDRAPAEWSSPRDVAGLSTVAKGGA